MLRALTVSLVSCLFWSPVLVAQEAQEKEDPKPAERKGERDARDTAKAAEMDRLRKRITEAIRRARARRGGGRVVRLPATKPVKKDAVHVALAEVQKAVQRARRMDDLKAMQEEINKAERALMKARRELWKKLRAKAKKKAKAKENAGKQDDEDGPTTEPPRKPARR